MATVCDINGNVVFEDLSFSDDQVENNKRYWDDFHNEVLTYERAVELEQNLWPKSNAIYTHIDKLTEREKEALQNKIHSDIKECRDSIKACQAEIKSSNETEKSFGPKGNSLIKGHKRNKRKEIMRLKERIGSYQKYLGRLFDIEKL